jgi:hypothetical protein
MVYKDTFIVYKFIVDPSINSLTVYFKISILLIKRQVPVHHFSPLTHIIYEGWYFTDMWRTLA